MKELIITIVLLLCCAAFIGHLEINLSPFSIRMPMWHRVVAVILFGMAIAFWTIGERRNAYSNGLRDGIKCALNEMIENNGDK